MSKLSQTQGDCSDITSLLVLARRAVLHIAHPPLSCSFHPLFLRQWLARHLDNVLAFVCHGLDSCLVLLLGFLLLAFLLLVLFVRVVIIHWRGLVDHVLLPPAGTAVVVHAAHADADGLFLPLLLLERLLLRQIYALARGLRCSRQLRRVRRVELLDLAPPPVLAHGVDAHVLLDAEGRVQQPRELGVELCELGKVQLAVAVEVEALERQLHVARGLVLVQNVHQMREFRALDRAIAIRIEHIKANYMHTARGQSQARALGQRQERAAHLSMSSLLSTQNLPSASTYSLKSSWPLLSSSKGQWMDGSSAKQAANTRDSGRHRERLHR